MLNLKNNLSIFCLIFLISACQSRKFFQIRTFNKEGVSDLHVITVRSQQVQQKCLFFDADAENKWRHQYILYILNDRSEVLEIMQPTNQDRETCYSQLKKIEKILKAELEVQICIRDELKKKPIEPEVPNEFIQFGTLGTHSITYDFQTLDSVCNSNKCFSNNEIWTNTCPGFVKH